MTEELAVEVIEQLGLTVGRAKASQLRKSPAMNKKRSPVVLIVGSRVEEKVHSELDILLPSMGWVSSAVERAQHNIVDFGERRIPVITLEDIIVAKLHSLADNISRYKDLDDLQSIFSARHEFDFVYLVSSREKNGLRFPRELKPDLPRVLKKYLAEPLTISR